MDMGCTRVESVAVALIRPGEIFATAEQLHQYPAWLGY